MGPHKIAVVTESFYPATDGTTTTVKNVVDRLIDTGHEVMIVAPGPGLATYRRSTVARIRPLDKPGGQVRDALAAFGPDLVHVTSPGTLGRKALKHARRQGVPALVVQQSEVPELTEEYWLRKVAARSDLTLVTCRSMQARLDGLGVAAPLWAPGVSTVGFGPQLRDEWLHGKWSRKRSRGGPLVVIGYVGSLHKRNGVRRLVDVARVPGVRLVVIGDGPQRGWLRGKLPGAKLPGAMSGGELATAFATFDIFVHPGERETDCHALREASASGVPVVAPAAGGTPDVIRHDKTGVLYDPTDERGLRRAVAALTSDAAARTSMGSRGRDHVGIRDWITAVDELIETHYPAAVARHDAEFAAVRSA